MIPNWSYSPETPNLGKIRRFSESHDLEIWRMTFNKANLRDLIAATGLVISNWIQIVNFSARVTAKFDGWPCKTIGHLFYATSSFVHHFVPTGEFKLWLQSGNAQFGSNLTIFRAMRPWNLTDDLHWGRTHEGVGRHPRQDGGQHFSAPNRFALIVGFCGYIFFV